MAKQGTYNPSTNEAMQVDVAVIGSGNGALTAAITAHDKGAKDVLVIEKSSLYGGSSAASGGGVWIPNNRYSKASGFKDSVEAARKYIKHLSPKGQIEDEMIDTFLQKGPEMIEHMHHGTRWVRYLNLPFYPDYFPDAPGGTAGNRSMEPKPVHARPLGKSMLWKLQGQHPQTQGPLGINFSQVEGQVLLGGIKGWQLLFTKLVLKYFLDIPARLRGKRDWRLTMGNAGIARLMLALKDKSIPLWLDSPVTGLIVEKGRVAGLLVQRDQRMLTIKTRKGVILASGGFERDQKMREQYLGKPTQTSWTAAGPGNTGEMIRAAQHIGAKTKQMDWAWWTTTAVVPGRDRAQMMMVEKSLPGNYTVDQNGERFSNESQNYVGFVEDLFRHAKKGGPCIPCYMIFDANFRRLRPCGPMVQGSMQPDWMLPRSWWKSNFLTKANSIRGLADKLGINPDNLEKTQRKVNEYTKTGKDPEFKRGDSLYDRYYGDPEFKPNPCLGSLSKPPFYAIALYPGEMGTAGGLVINTNSEVMHKNGKPIPGLYATGNCTTALLPRYPGPGSTLGPAMVFGYIAGCHINNNKSTKASNPDLVDSDRDNWVNHT
jgi:3-oxosteroid 1-dehydrogenase